VFNAAASYESYLPLSAVRTVRTVWAQTASTATVLGLVTDPKPSPNNSWNLTIQRELPGNSVLEIGYVRRTASQLYAPADLNQVPFFMTAGSQTFAQAFDNVAAQLRAGGTVISQPFFRIDAGRQRVLQIPNASCTAGVAAS